MGNNHVFDQCGSQGEECREDENVTVDNHRDAPIAPAYNSLNDGEGQWPII
jgi:hypothetical protein